MATFGIQWKNIETETIVTPTAPTVTAGSGISGNIINSDNAIGDSNNHLLCNTGMLKGNVHFKWQIKESKENCYLMVYVCKFNQCISSDTI